MVCMAAWILAIKQRANFGTYTHPLAQRRTEYDNQKRETTQCFDQHNFEPESNDQSIGTHTRTFVDLNLGESNVLYDGRLLIDFGPILDIRAPLFLFLSLSLTHTHTHSLSLFPSRLSYVWYIFTMGEIAGEPARLWPTPTSILVVV